MLVLHLHQHQSSLNLHLQYLANSQSTQRCQSLITPRSDHPLFLEPHMLSTWDFDARTLAFHCGGVGAMVCNTQLPTVGRAAARFGVHVW
jgi:hypothetical protein